MTDPGDNEVDRRGFLTFVGTSSATAATVALAGCLGGDDDDDGDANGDDDGGANGDDDGDANGDDDSDANGDDNGDENGDDNGDAEPFEITMTQTQDATTLDPHDHRETTTDNVILHAYEGILWRDREGGIIPSLATEWEQLEPDRHRFTIRDDVQFHDGTDMEPSDCAFSVRRVVDPEVGGLESPQRDQLAGIVDAEPAEDGNALIVHSNRPNPMTFPNLASFCRVVSEEWIGERESQEIATGMNGTGPYELTEYQEGESARFEAFDGYWGEQPEVDEVEIIAAGEDSTRVGQLEADETDIVSAVPPNDAGRVENSDDLYIADTGSTRILFMVMRYDAPPFDSVEFRQAMNYAIDLDQIVDEILRGFGQPTGQPTLPGFTGHDPEIEPYPYDPDQAEQLVEQSGYAGAEIEVHYPAGRYLLNDEITQAAVGFMDELDNVSAEAVSRDFGSLVEELLGPPEEAPPIYNIGWGNTTFDASQTLIPYLTEGGSAFFHYVDEEMEQLIADSNVETDPDQREQLLRQANQLAHDDAVWVFLNQEWLVYGINERIDWEPRQDEFFLAQQMERS